MASASRCRARNPLLCPEHYLRRGFTEVPAYVTRDLAKLVDLYVHSVQQEDELDSAALLEGVLPSEVGWVAFHHPDGAVPLRTLLLRAREAEWQFDAERKRQTRNAVDYVNDRALRWLPRGYSEAERYLLTNLVALRFLVVERDYPDDQALGYKEIFGMTREELFRPYGNRRVRAALRELDRAYLTAVTGQIPDRETLQLVAHERFVRYRGEASAEDSTRALDLMGDLFTRHLEAAEDDEYAPEEEAA